MTQSQANRTIVRLAREGRSYEEIAAMLHADGYVSTKTNKPLTPGAVNQRAVAAGFRKGRGSTRHKRMREKPVQASKSDAFAGEQLIMLRAILVANMAAAQKVKLALMVIK